MPDANRFSAPDLTVGIVGLGYVGLPLLLAFNKQGVATVGIDIDAAKIRSIESGKSYLEHIPDARIAALSAGADVQFSTSFEPLRLCDAILIAVPTPLAEDRTPDLSYVLATAESIGAILQPGQLIVLESTTYPGTTRERLAPRLEEGSGLAAGRDFLVAFSPEREDPGNPDFQTSTIPKVVGALSEEALQAAIAVYERIVTVIPVSSAEVAETTKLLENIYRAVNIALINELKLLSHRMDLDIWEVVDAAGTKPFGFQAFYPGPGLGGHCIPIDPFYLSWRARQFGFTTRFIELAGEINTAMPEYVVERLRNALTERDTEMEGSRILLLGVAYKRNVGDDRESPAYRIIDLLEEAGAEVSYHDSHVSEIGPTRRYGRLSGRRSEELTAALLRGVDAVVIVTDHDDVDYDLVGQESDLVIDTRNVMRDVGPSNAEVVQA